MLFDKYMDIQIFWKAFSLTFLMLFAIGPICMTVINTTVLHGIKAGLSAGFGVAIADIIYIIIAATFLEIASDVIKTRWIFYFGLMAGLYLIHIAYSFWKTDVSKIKSESLDKKATNLKRFTSLFFLTITGPTTILTYSAIFANFINVSFNAITVVIGASLGTISYYIVIPCLIALIRKKMSIQFISIVNKFSSIIILFFALMIIRFSGKNILGL